MSHRNGQRSSLSDFFPERYSNSQSNHNTDKQQREDSHNSIDRSRRGRLHKDIYTPQADQTYRLSSKRRHYAQESGYPLTPVTTRRSGTPESENQQSRIHTTEQSKSNVARWQTHDDPELIDQEHHLDKDGNFKYDKEKSQLHKTWYKVTYDPELSKDKSKGSSVIHKKVHEGPIIKIADPRLKSSFKDTYKSMKKYKKKLLPFSSLSVPRFIYDKNSVGPAPTSEIIISNLGHSVSNVYLRNELKTFGELLEDEVILDPESGIPLGLVRIKFAGPVEKAAQSAKKSVDALDKTKIDGNLIRVRLNKDGKVLSDMKNKVLQSIRVKKKISQIDAKKIVLPSAPKAILNAISRNEKTRQIQQVAQAKSLPTSVTSSPSLVAKTLSRPTIIQPTAPVQVKRPKVEVPEDLEKYIKGRPFIFLASKYIKNQLSRNDIKKALETYDWTRVLDDASGTFVVFNSPREAKRCYQLENGKEVFSVHLFMELQLPDGYSVTEEDENYLNKQRDVIEEATSLLTKELEDALQKDIRTKIIAPAVLEFLNIDNFPELKAELEAKQKQVQPPILAPVKPESVSVSMTQVDTQDDEVVDVFSLNKKIPKFPSFKKKNGVTTAKEEGKLSTKQLKSISKKQKQNLPLNYALNFEEDTDNEFRESSTSTPQLEKSHQELIDEPPKKKTRILDSRPEEHALYSSSSDEDEDEEEIATKESTPTTPEDDKMDIDIQSPKREVKEEQDGEIQAEDEEAVVSSFDSLHKPTKTEYPIPVYEDTPISTLTISTLQSLVKDAEDLELLKELYKDEMVESPIQMDLDYWAWKQKELAASYEAAGKGILSIPNSLENSTGSFSSQGYVKFPDEVKVEYLPHRKRVHDPLSTIQVENEENDTSKVQSSRANRSNNRRFAYEVSNFNTDNEILTMNQLNKRKKPVSFARSAIHNWGLYALEPIAEREMIIEYVGERIRQQVAEFREKSYLKSGIGSSYLFRVDENTVIDATKKGGIARFINHCCVPSCTAKIIKVEGEKRIVIYALRDIAANEELTYDYKFERETNDDERVRCLCGAPGCKGYLN